MPFKFLEFHKYQWVELDLVPHKHSDDFRPESHRPGVPDLSDLEIVGKLDTTQEWFERKEACLKNVYTNLATLIKDSQIPRNTSLAAFKPAGIRKFIVEEDEREWKPQWLEQLKQMDMLTSSGRDSSEPRMPIDKIPYKFKYEFEDDTGKRSTMTIEDWEIGALYRNCLSAAEGDESAAIEKVRQKYGDNFTTKNDITLFLGTTKKHHVRRYNNPFTIIGVFYPPRHPQQNLI